MEYEVRLIFKKWENHKIYLPTLTMNVIDGYIEKIPSDKLEGAIVDITPAIMRYSDISSKFVGHDIKVKESNLFTLYIPHKE